MNTQARERQDEALARALNGQSLGNYATIIQGFMERGIPEQDIEPRVNVLTFDAWKALGRYVKRGEHGVRVVTFIPCVKVETDEQGEERKTGYKRAWSATVFHISQTEVYHA